MSSEFSTSPPPHLSALPLSELKNLVPSSSSSSSTTTTTITDIKNEVLRRLYLRQPQMSEDHFDALMTLSAGYISEYKIPEEALEEKRLLVYLEAIEDMGYCMMDYMEVKDGVGDDGGGGG